MEWSTAYDFLSTQPLPKITLSLPEFPFSQGPPPVPLYFYRADLQQQGPVNTIPADSTEDSSLRLIGQDLPTCLERILGHRLLPYNLPEWIRPAIRLRNCSSNEVDMDIDIEMLDNILHRTALSELDNKRTDSARKFLLAQLSINPKSNITLYNLACAEALSGNGAEAIEYLNRAVKEGYRRVEHMIADNDLQSIAHTPEFQRIASNLYMLQIDSQVGVLKI